MKKLQPILTDSSDFPEIRGNGCVYVDKTAYFHDLITRLDARRFFLSRPRRFGKSLMISTLEAIFQGRKELFDGLAISKTDWKWEKYPVIHFNFINAAASTVEEFRQLFLLEVKRGITEAGGTFDAQYSAAGNFAMSIDELSARNDGKGVVNQLVALPSFYIYNGTDAAVVMFKRRIIKTLTSHPFKQV